MEQDGQGQKEGYTLGIKKSHDLFDCLMPQAWTQIVGITETFWVSHKIKSCCGNSIVVMMELDA